MYNSGEYIHTFHSDVPQLAAGARAESVDLAAARQWHCRRKSRFIVTFEKELFVVNQLVRIDGAATFEMFRAVYRQACPSGRVHRFTLLST